MEQALTPNDSDDGPLYRAACEIEQDQRLADGLVEWDGTVADGLVEWDGTVADGLVEETVTAQRE